ncbi:peptidase U35 [Primorskyibacter flagellatus]|uniref:Peptidase U35 n=1 Tax=Primorskyibacter flagellatus TaxID=1387277 RepID=A0A917A113_9RHOB|nr:HK97 family phage prohead protease [Primorskyibacter flagellatus]GGE21654.1 peptidase U35 [Primorskyibacter flagellatus]
MELEHKFSSFDAVVSVTDDLVIEGYASRFGDADQGGDTVQPGAYAASLASGRGVKMLWQHDVTQPIGVWDDLREDTHGLWVKGRLLDGVARAKEAAALIRAGAIDGLSIGYRTRRAVKNAGGGRTLMELELWEVSLVTFPMLPSARVAAKGDAPDADWRDLAAVFRDARLEMAGLRPGPNPLSER